MKERKEDPVIAYALTKKNEIVDAEIIDVGPRQIYVKIIMMYTELLNMAKLVFNIMMT